MPQKYTHEYMRDRIAWLRETLIPDLRDSGTDATADDFEMCATMIEQLLDASGGEDSERRELLDRINRAQNNLDEVGRKTRDAIQLYDTSPDGSEGKLRARRWLDELSTQRTATENVLNDLTDQLEV